MSPEKPTGHEYVANQEGGAEQESKLNFNSHSYGRNPKTNTEFVIFNWSDTDGEQHSIAIWRASEDGRLWWNVGGRAQGNGDNGEETRVLEYLEQTKPQDADNIRRILEL